MIAIKTIIKKQHFLEEEDVKKIVYDGEEPKYDLTNVEDLYYYCKKQYNKVKKI